MIYFSLLLFFLSGHWIFVDAYCGYKPKVRIAGGTEAPKNAWPWIAMLIKAHSGKQFCAGTLIHPTWVVSASHCLARKTASQIKIRMGAHYKVGNVGTEQVIDVQKIILHPRFHKPVSYAHDIALIKLARPAILNRAVGLACLPSNNLKGLVPGKKCWITGWGRLSAGRNFTNVLVQASVPIKAQDVCQRTYEKEYHDSMLCAGLDKGGVDSCKGDSGGPMVCEHYGRYYLEGVTSWGHGCAFPGMFGVYADVRYLRSWIFNTMAYN